MGFLLHLDFNIHNDKKIIAHYQYKKAKKDPEQNKIHTADIPYMCFFYKQLHFWD